MGTIGKRFSFLFILIIVGSSLIAFATLPFGLAQNGTNVSYIIDSDRIWTKAGSPYTLTGNVLVNGGVTLAISAGATVNLGSYYIMVNGSLNAKGTSIDPIIFNGGSIAFTSSSVGWNQQTNSGCLIENANINHTSINSDNPLKIDNSYINGNIFVTSSIISNNIITGAVSGSNSIISNNIVKGDITTQVSSAIGSIKSESSVISNNAVNGNINIGYFSLSASGDASTVFNNTINGSISSVSGSGTPQIFNNTVSNGGIRCAGYGSIFNNYIYGCQNGINLFTPRGFGGNLPCYATVENNLIADNVNGINIGLTSTFDFGVISPTILNNTISGNSVGITLSENYYNSTPMFLNNNLQNNSKYNFYLAAPNNINATYNWWGTTDQSAISNSIYDFNKDFNLGKVNFVPFLTAFNPQTHAVPILVASPTPKSNPSSTPSPTPTVPEFPPLAILPLIIAMLYLALMKRKEVGKSRDLDE